METFNYKGWTIKEYFSKCSKPNCKICSDGQGHGPYIYAKTRINGQQVRKYLGKELPDNLDEKLGISDISEQILQLQSETYKILKITATVECNGEKKDIILYKRQSELHRH